jgi:hypothetical protein
MNRTDALSDSDFESCLNQTDLFFRKTIEKKIIDTKFLTHQCQANCYNQPTDLAKAEECARNCFQPMINVKRNVTKIVEIAREKVMKCKVDNMFRKDGSIAFFNVEMQKCIARYKKNMEESKEEIEFIYDGYNKNFEKLLPLAKETKNRGL